MAPVTTHAHQSTPPTPVLHVAFELADQRWTLAFTPGLGQRPRGRTVAARDLDAVRQEVARGLTRFRLPPDTRVVSCYEAGRAGFWLHRALTTLGVANSVVDSASIDVIRRATRAKADRLAHTVVESMYDLESTGGSRHWTVL